MLYQMIKFNNIAGSRAMAIITNNLEQETAEDVLSLVLQSLVPVTIKKYLPVETTEEANK